MIKRIVFIVMVFSLLVTSCNFPQTKKKTDSSQTKAKLANNLPSPTITTTITLNQDNVTQEDETDLDTDSNPVQTPTPTFTNTPEPAATATMHPVGPNFFPQGINPLTGLPVSDPNNLAYPPALISVTNFPDTARPQAGLDYSPFVFELYIGDGESRFLVLFYGDYPSQAFERNINTSSGGKVVDEAKDLYDTNAQGSIQNASIGPIRSGRLPYESVRKIFNGFLVMASAYSGVANNLSQYANIYGSDQDDVNSAMIKVSYLEDIARSNQLRLGEAAMSGMLFDPVPPEDGKPANRLWFMYSYLNQIIWRYDPNSDSYNRTQNTDDAPEDFFLAKDKLTDVPLTYENVVILFANHRMCNEYVIDIDLMYIKKAPALIFRDGQIYTAYWTTLSEEYERKTGKLRPIRFIDENGDPFPFKPGQTWMMFAPLYTPYWENAGSEQFYSLANSKEPGSGNWAMRFYPSMFVYDESICRSVFD